MDTTQTQPIEYPATAKVYIDYGLRGRLLGPYKDILEHFHEIDRLTDARQLINDFERPFTFDSLQNTTRGVLYWVVLSGIISLCFLFYLVVISQQVEQGLEQADIYYLILLILILLTVVTYFRNTRKFQKELLEYVGKINQSYVQRGVELKVTPKYFSWRGGIQILITRFKQGATCTGTQTPDQRSFVS